MAADKRHLHRYDAAKPSHRPTTLSELAILQKNHQFIREDDNNTNSSSKLSWEDQLARQWYNKLFREYAVCDLSQYKTGGVALRWRTEDEVLARTGELTCGNLHCKNHLASLDLSPLYRHDDEEDTRPLVPTGLTPYQLNFAYVEQGKQKQALVKVVLCNKCSRKLTYKKDKEREAAEASEEKRQVTGNGGIKFQEEGASTHERDWPRDDDRRRQRPDKSHQDEHSARKHRRDRQDSKHRDRARERSRSPNRRKTSNG